MMEATNFKGGFKNWWRISVCATNGGYITSSNRGSMPQNGIMRRRELLCSGPAWELSKAECWTRRHSSDQAGLFLYSSVPLNQLLFKTDCVFNNNNNNNFSFPQVGCYVSSLHTGSVLTWQSLFSSGCNFSAWQEKKQLYEVIFFMKSALVSNGKTL